jgi:glycosyltransferase involved in cell wall biosynthesis
MPVYDGARFVEEAVRSVLAQAWRPLEVVAVDDGSKDGSLAILEGLARAHAGDDGAVVRVRAERNGGVGRARNVGLADARGEYVTFLDHDDVLTPGSLEVRAAAVTTGTGTSVRGSGTSGNALPIASIASMEVAASSMAMVAESR